MANTLPSLTLLAEEALPVLQSQVPLFSAFASDFSSDLATAGSAVATRIPSAITATYYSAANGYVNADATTTAVTVTLQPTIYSTVAFDDSEVSNIGMSKLINTFVKPCIKSVCTAVATGVYGLVTSANYGTHVYSGTSYTFDNMVGTPLSKLALSGVSSDKAVVLNPSAYYGLLNDVKANSTIGDVATIREGYIGNLGGAAVVMGAGMPNNGEGLAGFACGKEAVAIATRVPFAPSNTPNLQVANVTDPESGLTVQLRQWYDATKGKTYFGAFLMAGWAKGNGGALQRIRNS